MFIFQQRAAILQKWQALMMENKKVLAEIISTENVRDYCIDDLFDLGCKPLYYVYLKLDFFRESLFENQWVKLLTLLVLSSG